MRVRVVDSTDLVEEAPWEKERRSVSPFPPGSQRPMQREPGAQGKVQPPRNQASRGRVRCGSKAHQTFQCPDKYVKRLSGANVAEKDEKVLGGLIAALVAERDVDKTKIIIEMEESAPFYRTTMERGLGIGDFGCTDSVGGVQAVDAAAQVYLKRQGDSRLTDVGLGHKPVHSWGDGERGRARGRVRLQVQPGGLMGNASNNAVDKDIPTLTSSGVARDSSGSDACAVEPPGLRAALAVLHRIRPMEHRRGRAPRPSSAAFGGEAREEKEA
ncbi:unnamed protein product [Prorocentrum cordatum]|uniref:Subtilisin n=1 Tax=Prorocentrum cordatum TaxID=2364126 RepID=A0ABN9UT57_9DINO|nr:unnamed protein product [Polarella glacialis]